MQSVRGMTEPNASNLPKENLFKEVVQQPHHERREVCTSRPRYRQGRKFLAVKVYTVNEESRHLLIHGVPSISLTEELKSLCERFGSVEHVELQTDYPRAQFTEVYYVRYCHLKGARFAKKRLDDREFYGGILHVCYAPELEMVEDTHMKLQQRKMDVEQRLEQPGQTLFHNGMNLGILELLRTLIFDCPGLGIAATSSLEYQKPKGSSTVELHHPVDVPLKKDAEPELVARAKRPASSFPETSQTPTPHKKISLAPKQPVVKRIVYLNKNTIDSH